MKNCNRNIGEAKDFIFEKLTDEMNRGPVWNGSADIMWTNIENKLDERRKAWRIKFRIHLILAFILLVILALMVISSRNSISTFL